MKETSGLSYNGLHKLPKPTAPAGTGALGRTVDDDVPTIDMM